VRSPGGTRCRNPPSAKVRGHRTRCEQCGGSRTREECEFKPGQLAASTASPLPTAISEPAAHRLSSPARLEDITPSFRRSGYLVWSSTRRKKCVLGFSRQEYAPVGTTTATGLTLYQIPAFLVREAVTTKTRCQAPATPEVFDFALRVGDCRGLSV